MAPPPCASRRSSRRRSPTPGSAAGHTVRPRTPTGELRARRGSRSRGSSCPTSATSRCRRHRRAGQGRRPGRSRHAAASRSRPRRRRWTCRRPAAGVVTRGHGRKGDKVAKGAPIAGRSSTRGRGRRVDRRDRHARQAARSRAVRRRAVRRHRARSRRWLRARASGRRDQQSPRRLPRRHAADAPRRPRSRNGTHALRRRRARRGPRRLHGRVSRRRSRPASVALVERWPTLGGVCLNVGCIPSKALLHAAKRHRRRRTRWRAHGIEFGTPKIDAAKLREWKNTVVAQADRRPDGAREAAQGRRCCRARQVRRRAHARGRGHEAAASRVTFAHCIIAAGSESMRLPGLARRSAHHRFDRRARARPAAAPARDRRRHHRSRDGDRVRRARRQGQRRRADRQA